MKKKILGLILITGILSTNCQKEELTTPQLKPDSDVTNQTLKHGDIIPNSYIVVYKQTSKLSNIDEMFFEVKKGEIRNFDVNNNNLDEIYDKKTQTYRKEYEIIFTESEITPDKIERIYTGAIYGVSAKLTKEEVEILRMDKRIDFIEPNRFVELSYIVEDETISNEKAQTVPWGISRVGYTNYSGDKVAWIIDTGVQSNHPDLNVWTGGCRSFVTGQTYNDGNGHGTHVAGTIGAINNTIGVVGVAAGVPVAAVKVLDNSGNGSYAAIISGIDYVRSNAWAGDVANMSLGGPASTALDNAVISLANKGVWCVIAAGNDYKNANNYSPARVNGTYIYTISSHDVNNKFSTFSNYGNPPIDWCAPGTSIYSTWINSSYKTISGTSMATPHVVGIRLMGAPRSGGYVTSDPDGSADRRAVR
ncbi:MAG: S8 family serine peptidase [Gudongella sp.]|nr:S8 family serine peptidase [Gudongella sp.]